MAKVEKPLFSEEVSGHFGKQMIFRRGGVVTRYFKPRDAKTDLQIAARLAFRNMVMNYITQEQADALYALISHGHLHSELGALQGDDHMQYLNTARHDLLARHGQASVDHGLIAGLLDDDHPHYLTQSRGDVRYMPLTQRLWPTVLKGGPTEIVNSAALGSDLDLRITLPSYNYVSASGAIFFQTANGAGLRWRMVWTGTQDIRAIRATMDYMPIAGGTVVSSLYMWNAAAGGTVLVPTTASYEGIIRFDIFGTQSATAGLLVFQRGQNVSSASSCWIEAGSHLNAWVG